MLMQVVFYTTLIKNFFTSNIQWKISLHVISDENGCIDFQLSHYMVPINVSWFGKHDPFFNFHDVNFPN